MEQICHCDNDAGDDLICFGQCVKFLIARRPPIDGQLTPSSTMLHHASTLLCYIFLASP